MGTLELLQPAMGASFALAGLIAWRARPESRTGLLMTVFRVVQLAAWGLADRVKALDGTLRVWSPRGEGTRLRAEIPCG